MPIELRKHNEEAYRKVVENFKTSNRTAIVHPTGTGKMYIALKLLEENNDKKAVYIAPSNSILHAVKKSIFEEGMDFSNFPNLKRITYQKLSQISSDELEKLNADIIILDEFHHCGAPEWGKGVNQLIQKNPNANILGLSATPIRYSDDLRDMADEMFDNNVSSEMSLEEAIDKGILPEATYVSALYGYQDELKNMKSRISEISSDSRRKEAEDLFDELRKKLDKNTENLPELLEKYMQNKTGKYIIFCRDIDDMNQKMQETNQIFGSINSNITQRCVSFKLRDNEKILTEFEKDDDQNTLKLLYSVDMLNEGYHLKDIDGVIMMRPTISPTIFTQQLGRALTVGENASPVVLDLVNNFDSCQVIEQFAKNIREYNEKNNKSQTKEVKGRISIFDKTKEFRDIANRIKELSKREKNIDIDKRIEDMIAWKKLYPKIEITSKEPHFYEIREYGSSDEEIEKIYNERKDMHKYYDFLKTKFYRGELSQDQFAKCKEGNIRGIFGYPSKIEKIANSFGINESKVDNIINTYGSIDNFKESYIHNQVCEKVDGSEIFRKCIDVDLNTENKFYDNLMSYIKTNNIEVYSSIKLEEALKKINPNHRNVIQKIFGYEDGKMRTLNDVANEMRVTRANISRIQNEVKRALVRNGRKSKIYNRFFVR